MCNQLFFFFLPISKLQLENKKNKWGILWLISSLNKTIFKTCEKYNFFRLKFQNL